MDDTTFSTLSKIALKNVSLISLEDFEDEELLKAKGTRSLVEYCWTCTPSLPLYILRKHPNLQTIAYLDSDLFFFSSPEPIYEELEDRSILIIEHRFLPRLKYMERSGIYNVGMLIFRNNFEGLSCLSWWRDRCNEWCYRKVRDEKAGDQKYLDDWPTRFPSVHVLKHKGANVALWNLYHYRLSHRDRVVFVDGEPLIFYHFTLFKILSENSFLFGDKFPFPSLSEEQKKWIYQPYIHILKEQMIRIHKYAPHLSFYCDQKTPSICYEFLQDIAFRFEYKFRKLLKGK